MEPTQEQRRTSRRWTPERTITAAIIAVVMVVVASILFAAQRNATTARTSAAEQAVNETADLLADDIANGVRSVGLLENALGTDRWQDAELVESFLISIVDLDGGIDTAYIGYSDGSFRGVFEAGGVTNIVRVDADSGRQVQVASIEMGEEPRFEETGETFDPRGRPWFRDEVDDEGVSWTEPYGFFGGEERGVSATRVLQAAGDDGIAVIGFDVRFPQIASLLDRVAPRDGVTIIVEDGEEVVASTTGAAVSASEPDVSESGDGGEPSIVRLTDHSVEFPDWTIRAEVDDVGPSDVLTNRTIAVIFLVLLVAVAVRVISTRAQRRVQGRLDVLGAEARRDHLSGLSNRLAIEEDGSRLIRDHRRDGLEVCVAALDLDDFKTINDDHGHAAGDQTIQRAAGALASFARDGDVVGRLGGDEFVWIFAAPSDEVDNVLARMHAEITRALRVGPLSLETSLTLGATERRGREVSLADMLIEADDCLIRMKRTSKGIWSVTGDNSDRAGSAPALPDAHALVRS